jgi:hypothetical protein
MNPLGPPPINFRKEMVIVTMLGYQTSGGGPGTKVLGIRLDEYERVLQVLVEDDETPGPLDIITNPFHIIKLKKLNTHSVFFEHNRPKGTTKE